MSVFYFPAKTKRDGNKIESPDNLENTEVHAKSIFPFDRRFPFGGSGFRDRLSIDVPEIGRLADFDLQGQAGCRIGNGPRISRPDGHRQRIFQSGCLSRFSITARSRAERIGNFGTAVSFRGNRCRNARSLFARPGFTGPFVDPAFVDPACSRSNNSRFRRQHVFGTDSNGSGRPLFQRERFCSAE